MNQFHYTALSETGQKVTGDLEAESEAAVLRVLGDKRLFPVSVRGKGAVGGKPKTQSYRVRSRELGIMYGQLADLIGSGVPLLRALDSLVKSTVHSRLQELLKEIRISVAEGKSLTDSFRQFPEVFPVLHTAMVQAGERAAFLEDVLRSLAGFLERLDELRSKVLGALIYPALLMALGSAVMVGALIFFVPKFEPLLANAKKPLPTELLFWASQVVRSYWYVLIVAFAGLVALVWANLRSEKARRTIEVWRLKIPVVGDALRLVAITRFCRILGTMLANGVPMLQALKISKDATGSTLLGERIAEAAEAVRDGKRLSEPLGTGGFFPEQVLAMIAVAEESNKLDKVLVQIADTVERRTNRQVDQAVRLVEPAILCLVAMGIGFLALGLLLPIFTMASQLGSR
ncbi:MAG: type II secretion system F family protein [Verrucomicrobia bacterium]|nr:type II secretion system F family protein [Verrucomicrobiota bacterium]MBI3868156.1 type II secretion system F family protein [Verrucomicrobiota bacterium]